MTAYLDAVRRYAVFSGRSSRSQFWFYHLTLLGLAVAGFIIDIAISGGSEPQPLISALIVIGHYIPSLAIIVRRLHDANLSGWLVLLCLLPGIGVIAFIVFGCLAPTPGPNRFDPSHSTGSQSATDGQTGASQAAGASAVERIEKLASLRASGAINDGEFERMKADVLGKTEQGNG
ncbi:DUF805 domain-containing protein [Neorhizobium sp. S3-V5DH]|uniref:DUF805 domain-containing protein n=1 Tax=Neorhizobium sp. S3-V5DH TaxID=2485166 RepID=UPI0010525E2F|nr:DUF805 domain-containing protein [Neorhizobium sp. S3-V5DH]